MWATVWTIVGSFFRRLAKWLGWRRKDVSKPKVDWAFQELATSAKLDEMTLDDLRKGDLIFHMCASHDPADLNVYVGWFLYNPAKAVFDRLRIFGWFVQPVNGPAVLQYSLDSGSTWNAATLSQAGIPATVIVTTGQNSIGNTNFQLGVADVDLSTVASTQWVGVRLARPTAFFVQLNLSGYLYLSSDTPF